MMGRCTLASGTLQVSDDEIACVAWDARLPWDASHQLAIGHSDMAHSSTINCCRSWPFENTLVSCFACRPFKERFGLLLEV